MFMIPWYVRVGVLVACLLAAAYGGYHYAELQAKAREAGIVKAALAAQAAEDADALDRAKKAQKVTTRIETRVVHDKANTAALLQQLSDQAHALAIAHAKAPVKPSCPAVLLDADSVRLIDAAADAGTRPAAAAARRPDAALPGPSAASDRHGQ